MTLEELLIVRAAQVARSAPESWNDFLLALGEYSNLQTSNCIQSPLEELPRAQGRAQAAARINQILATCLVRADQIEGRRK